MGNPEGKRSIGRPRSRWEDNIKMQLEAVGFGGMDWIDMLQDRNNNNNIFNCKWAVARWQWL